MKQNERPTSQNHLRHVTRYVVVALVAFCFGRICEDVGKQWSSRLCRPCLPVQQLNRHKVALTDASIDAMLNRRGRAQGIKHTQEVLDMNWPNGPSHLETGIPHGDKLPDLFANNSLFLQTIRLTKSHEVSVDDLHVDLFGFPGDLTRVTDERKDWLECQNITNGVNETLWGRNYVEENVTMFCQLGSETYQKHSPQKLFRMFFVPMYSLDPNQDASSPLLWRCNITETLNKTQLIRLMGDPTRLSALTVHIWMSTRDDRSRITMIATFSIPLDTGAMGVSTVPTRSGAAKSYFHKPPVSIGLCVAVHTERPLRYLGQFVQHHLNVGFSSIVIGVQGAHDSHVLTEAKRLLARYIDQDAVALTHYDGAYGTQEDPAKLQFYLPCLYHYKGIAKYVATWDIDEFWVPPSSLNVDGRHNLDHVNLDDEVRRDSAENESIPDLTFNATLWPTLSQRIVDDSPSNNTQATTADKESKPSLTINASSWSTFPRIVTDDPLWQNSPYAQSVSISDTVHAIERYYDEQGCASSFCYHALPSHVVFIRNSHNEVNRTTRISQDFYERLVGYTDQWQKSISNTKYAHSLGFHLGGSCFFESYLDTSQPSSTLREQFYEHSKIDICYARRFDDEVYGSMHHFYELLKMRHPGDYYMANSTQPDEYVSIFAPTVERQLERDDPDTFTISRYAGPYW